MPKGEPEETSGGDTMIGEMLKFAGKHPKGVILGLLTIIVAGGTAGGIWIHNLQSALEERDKLVNERLALIEERHRDHMRSLEQSNAVLRTQRKIIENNIQDLSQQLLAVGSLLGEIQKNEAVTEDLKANLRAASEHATARSGELSQALQRSKDAQQWLDDVTGTTKPEEEISRFGLDPIFVLIFIALGTLLYFVLRLWRRRRQSDATS